MSPSSEPGLEQLATCHAIIGHPTKPKFLAIRHTQGWEPPTVKFPPGPIDYRPTMINKGMNRKYGLHTRILRPLFSSSRYHCLEMELVGRGSLRLEAVWVGREEYLRLRTPPGELPDPFEKWLDERERNLRPALRPPWEYAGWFDQASHWIQFQLDCLQLQATGSVEQFGVGSNASCLLRVATGAGFIYFKAAHDRPPAEAAFTAALARAWPRHIDAPLAIDTDRNWMLSRDLRGDARPPRGAAELLPFVRAMAELQIASSANLRAWEALGCPVRGCSYLQDFTASAVPLQEWLRAGGGRLSAEEMTRLDRAIDRQRVLVEQLAAVGLADALVHTDFRPDNLVRWDAEPAFIDWSGCVIGQPFFVLERLLGTPGRRTTGAVGDAGQTLREDQSAEVRRAYLEPFTQQVPMERLVEALELSRRLYPLWRFTRYGEDLAWMEPESVRYQTYAVWLQAVARRMIREYARSGVPAA